MKSRTAAVAGLVMAATTSVTTAALLAGATVASADNLDTGGFSWDATDRTAVVAAFARHYLPSQDYAGHVGWSGDVDMCVADTLSSEFLDDTLRRINWFRAQAGVAGDVAGDATLDAKAQAAALIMAEQGALSHDPATDFPDNACLSMDGIAAAAKSNLALGSYGPGAIDFLMRDAGGRNSAVGHRRWTLYLRQKQMGNGAIPLSPGVNPTHAQYVFSAFKPPQAPRAVAWPNEGFVPWQVVPDDGDVPPRWSFSYPGADFSSATATVERLGPGGGFLATIKEPVDNRFGDNTLVWQLGGVPDARPEGDTSYHIVVTGVANAPTSTFTYDVTVIDPYDLGLDLQPSGSPAPDVGGITTYGFEGFVEADGYSVRQAHASAAGWLEGAEDADPARIIDETSASYPLRDTAVPATGEKSFHLTAPGHLESRQSFGIDRIVVPSPSSTLRFKNMRRCATVTSRLVAQISRGGEHWETLWSRSGKSISTCTYGQDWDPDFQNVEVPIGDKYAGATVAVRFVFTTGSTAFYGSGTGTGVFVDDVSVTDSAELVDSEVWSLPAGSVSFDLTPVDARELWLQVRAEIGETSYSWSTPTIVAPSATCGDVNTDGNISATDALLALKAAVGSRSCPLSACDANGSMSLSAGDALLILKVAVGTPTAMDCPAV